MKFSEPARMHLTNLQVPGVSDYYTAKLVHYTSFSLIHWLGVPAAHSALVHRLYFLLKF